MTSPNGNRLLILLGLWILLGCLDLAFASWNHPESVPDQVERYLFHLRFGILPMGVLILYIPYFLSIYLVHKGSGHLKLILGAGILFRIVLLPSLPILETDLFRYLWDGHLVNSGHNPYRYAPLEIESGLNPGLLPLDMTLDLEELVEENRTNLLHREILANINNKSVPTLYFPLAQYLFALGDTLVSTVLPLREIEGLEIDWPRMAAFAIVIWKVVLFPIEIGILFLTVSLLRKTGVNPSWVLVYAWSPLVLKEYGNTGHYDPLVVFLTLLGLRLALEVGKGGKHQILSGLVFGAAIGCKAFPLLFLPFLWKQLRGLGMAMVLFTLIVLYFPFLGIGSQLFRGLATYSDRWEFNSGLVAFNEWWISKTQDAWASSAGTETLHGDGVPNPLFTVVGVEFTLDAFFLAKAISGILVLTVLGTLTWKSWKETEEQSLDSVSLVRKAYVMIGTLLLVSPVTDPWYVCWIVPFLCFFPNRAWLYLTFSQQVYYLYFWNDWAYVRFADVPWFEIDSNWEVARMAEYVPFYLLLLWGWWQSRKKSRTIPRC